jgi:hypothetical protein
MTAPADDTPTAPVEEQAWTPWQKKAWRLALFASMALLGLLGWLLARLLWLPLYFGLFFFLVAGLLVGAIAFRLARSARPIQRRRLLGGTLIVAIVTTLITIGWEYHHVADTAGIYPKFAPVYDAVARKGKDVDVVGVEATSAFKRELAAHYPPGGVLGYVKWAFDSGELQVDVFGHTEKISIEHRGYAWPIRTLAACLLVMGGLWLSFESLRSPSPVSNILPKGEEYEDFE